MGTTTRARAILLTSAMAIAAACDRSSDEAPSDDLPPPSTSFTPPTMPDAGSPAPRSTKTDGWLVVDPGAAEPVMVNQAIAIVAPTKGNKAAGTMRLLATNDGLRIKVAFTGLSFMQKYTLRVHLLGNCSSEDGSSAGPSFNFDGSSLTPPQGQQGLGDLGEVQADVGGEAKGEGKLALPAIQGPYSIVGRSVVLHAKSSDPSKANAEGARLACGVIGIFAEDTSL